MPGTLKRALTAVIGARMGPVAYSSLGSTGHKGRKTRLVLLPVGAGIADYRSELLGSTGVSRVRRAVTTNMAHSWHTGCQGAAKNDEREHDSNFGSRLEWEVRSPQGKWPC